MSAEVQNGTFSLTFFSVKVPLFLYKTGYNRVKILLRLKVLHKTSKVFASKYTLVMKSDQFPKKYIILVIIIIDALIFPSN